MIPTPELTNMGVGVAAITAIVFIVRVMISHLREQSTSHREQVESRERVFMDYVNANNHRP